MKRILAILLALLMLFAVCACDKDDKKGNEDENKDKDSATTYSGSLLRKGDDAVLTIDGDVATFKATLVNKSPDSQQVYSVTLTSSFTKEGENYVFDFTKEGTKALVSLSVTGAGAADFLNTIKNLSYKSDPLYVDFCEGKEVEITSESTVWNAIGMRKNAVIKLNGDNTFSHVD